jgi:holin-like protein
MNIITQCGFLFSVCLTGTYISRLLPFPVPASVLSMLVLFVLLLSRRIDASSLRETTDTLLGSMALFFIPSGVGILAHIEHIRGSVVALLTICLVTALLTFAVSALTVAAAIRFQARLQGRIRGSQPE